MFELRGKKALVTGGASGIGEAVSRLFVQAGAEVLALDTDENRLRHLADSVSDVKPIQCDITDETQVAEVFAGLTKLDSLVNCAGVGTVGTIEETELEVPATAPGEC